MPKIKVFLREIRALQVSKTYVFQSYHEPEVSGKVEVAFNTLPLLHGGGLPEIPYDEKDIGELFFLELPERALPK